MDNTLMAHTYILESYLSIAYGWKIGFIGFALPIQYIYYSIIIFALSGSPAEKADLEVADEILEINGQSLDNSNHTDVIAHIHNVRNENTLLGISARKPVFWLVFDIILFYYQTDLSRITAVKLQ